MNNKHLNALPPGLPAPNPSTQNMFWVQPTQQPCMQNMFRTWCVCHLVPSTQRQRPLAGPGPSMQIMPRIWSRARNIYVLGTNKHLNALFCFEHAKYVLGLLNNFNNKHLKLISTPCRPLSRARKMGACKICVGLGHGQWSPPSTQNMHGQCQ